MSAAASRLRRGWLETLRRREEEVPLLGQRANLLLEHLRSRVKALTPTTGATFIRNSHSGPIG